MHKKIFIITLFYFFHLSSFGRQSPEQKMLKGGIELLDESLSQITQTDQEKDSKKSKFQSLFGRLRKVENDYKPLLIQSATVATLPVVKECKNITWNSYLQMEAINKFNRVSTKYKELSLKSKVPIKTKFYQLKAAANGDQAGAVFDSLISDVPNRVMYGIPRVAFKAAAGQLVPQMFSNDAYKQIVYRHIVYCLIDATNRRDGQIPDFDTLAPQFVREATVEAVSWALTEFIFNRMDKNGCDPSKFLPDKLRKHELMQAFYPVIKQGSMLVVYGVISGYVVAPGYDKAVLGASGRIDNQMKLCMLSIGDA